MHRMWKFTKCGAWCRVTVGSDTPRLLFRGSASFCFLPSYISLARCFLSRLLFLSPSSCYPKWYTSRADKPEYVDLTFPSARMDARTATDRMSRRLYVIISGSRFFFFSGSNSRDAAWSRIQFHELRNITRHASVDTGNERERRRKETTNRRNDRPLAIRNSRGGSLSRSCRMRAISAIFFYFAGPTRQKEKEREREGERERERERKRERDARPFSDTRRNDRPCAYAQNRTLTRNVNRGYYHAWMLSGRER